MRVFITGGTGFIGGRFIQALLREGHEVVGLARSERSAKVLREGGAEVVLADLTDAEALTAAVQSAAPTHVAHLAAEIATQRDPARIFLVNVVGTKTLIAACRELNLERFLFLSTVVRGEADGALLTEDEPIPTTTTYGRSKQEGDEAAMAAHSEWGLPAVVLRPSHIYGPGGWFEELVTDRMFRIPGSGNNLWDVAHVDDVVAACMLLLQSGVPGEAYHVVDDEPLTMNEFFALTASAMGRKTWGHVPAWVARLIKGGDPIASAVRSARSTNAKLKHLGWVPRYPRAQEGLEATAALMR